MTKTHYSKFIPKVKVILFDDEKVFGKGVATLLHLIYEHKSMRKASKIMNMSYTKAWNMIKRLEKSLGYKVTNVSIGGSNGGESELTYLGYDLIDKYDKMMEDINEYTKKSYKKYFKEESIK